MGPAESGSVCLSDLADLDLPGWPHADRPAWSVPPAGGRDSSGMELHGVPLRPPRSIPVHGKPRQSADALVAERYLQNCQSRHYF